jgi:hypothetical protein
MDMVETILVTGATGTVGESHKTAFERRDRCVNIKAASHPLEKIKKVVKSDKIELIEMEIP